MSLPRISIVTPSFQQGHFLEETLCSILDQNYPALDLIVIDGGSTDGSVSILQKYSKYLHYWHSKPDLGQTDAINKGFAHVRGDVFNWINSDDILLPNALEHVGNVFDDESRNVLEDGLSHRSKQISSNLNKNISGNDLDEGPSHAFEKSHVDVYSGKAWIFENQWSHRLSQTDGVYFDPRNLDKTMGWLNINQPETFFRTSLIRHFFPMPQLLKYNMDKWLWLQVLLQHGSTLNILKDAHEIAGFRLHESSKTVDQASEFRKERDAIWYAFAQAAEMESFIPSSWQGKLDLQKQDLKDVFSAKHWNLKDSNGQTSKKEDDLSRNLPHHLTDNSPNNFANILQYALLKKIDELFVDQKFAEAKFNLKLLQWNYLHPKDQWYAFKLYLRINFLNGFAL